MQLIRHAMPYSTTPVSMATRNMFLGTRDGHQDVVYKNAVRFHVLSCLPLHRQAEQFTVYDGAHFVYVRICTDRRVIRVGTAH